MFLNVYFHIAESFNACFIQMRGGNLDAAICGWRYQSCANMHGYATFLAAVFSLEEVIINILRLLCC